MAEKANAPDQVHVCTKQCGGRCCRYLTVQVSAPRGHSDWDEVRWWLAHEGVMVTKDEDGWMLHVSTRCQNLQPNNLCGIYGSRMTTCSEYEAENCEFTGDVPYAVELHSVGDLADYLEKRKLKRGAAVAQSIREAARVGSTAPRLAQILPLR